MIEAIEAALDQLGYRHRRFGPFVVLTFDCDLASYALPLPVDLRATDGYLVGRAFLYGPVALDASDPVVRFAAQASAQLAGAKLVVIDGNVLIQSEESAQGDLSDQVGRLLGRLISAAQLVALEVVSLATDSTVQRLVLAMLVAPFEGTDSTFQGETEALVDAADGPANQVRVALTVRSVPDDAPEGPRTLPDHV